MAKKEYTHDELVRISNRLKITKADIDRINKAYPVVADRPWHEDRKLKVLKEEVKRQLGRSPWANIEDAVDYA